MPKQVYIPALKIKGTFIEEVGQEGERTMYPGKEFTLDLAVDDFDSEEDYHTVWIAITKAVKKKLTQ